MNIQIDVLIWTVINFCLLYAVLRFLLFKPMLANMDKRNTKIAEAKKRRDDAESAREKAKTEREKARIDAAAQRRAEEQEELRRVAEDCAEQRANAEAERRMFVSQRISELEAEEKELCALASKQMDALSDRLVNRILNKG